VATTSEIVLKLYLVFEEVYARFVVR
jgi:hypothetical protein